MGVFYHVSTTFQKFGDLFCPMYLQLIWTGVNCHNLLKNQIALTFYNISYDRIKYSDLHWVAVCTITSRSHGNGKTDIGLSNLDMPTKRVSFSHSPHYCYYEECVFTYGGQ